MQLVDQSVDEADLIEETYDDFEELDDSVEYSEKDKDIIALMKEIDAQTEDSIRVFFGDKKWHCGGSIPEHELVSKEKIDVCEQLDLQSAIGLFYCYITDYVAANPEFKFNGVLLCKKLNYNIEIEKEDEEDSEEYEQDYIVCREVLDECSIKKVPKNRAGGILLMYLSLVVGVPIDWLVLAEKVGEISGCVVEET